MNKKIINNQKLITPSLEGVNSYFNLKKPIMTAFYKMMTSYLLTTLVFFVVDMLWLGLIAKNIYRKYLGALLSETVNWVAALIFYLLFIAGIFILVIYPSIEKQSPGRAVVLGAIFGLITYATYDLTNYATLKGFPVNVVIIDLIRGTVLTTLVSISGYYITKYVGV